MSSTVQEMKGNLLLCDDLSDTGVTLNKSIDWLRKYPPLQGNIKDIKTAVLWKKKDSTFEPDYCAQKLNSNPWIVQPFENYEEVRVEDLVKKHQEVKGPALTGPKIFKLRKNLKHLMLQLPKSLEKFLKTYQ